jgi:hypothetical protein
MADFLETRWRGVRHVFWGSQLRNMQVTTALHMELYNVDRELMRQQVTPPAAKLPQPAEVAAQR